MGADDQAHPDGVGSADGGSAAGVVDLAAVATRQDFGRALTSLRQRAGLTVRDVARAVDVPPATVGGYFSGRHVPPVKMAGLLRQILGACGVVEPSLVAAWDDVLMRVRATMVRREVVAPYRGLSPYGVEDTEVFFGRAALTDSLVAALGERARGGGALLVVGPSGSGKSSVVCAGLLAALRGGALAQGRSSGWRQMVVTPTAVGVEALFGELAAVSSMDIADLARCAREDPRGCARAVEEALGAIAGEDPCHLVVVIDQAELLFANTDDDRVDTVVRLLAAFAGLCDEEHDVHEEQGEGNRSRVLPIVVLRADFYGLALRSPTIASFAQHGQVVVGPMREPELREAIAGPARVAGAELDDGLVDLLVREMSPTSAGGGGVHEAGSLPLLSHALMTTWERSTDRRITTADYQATGGIREAVARTAETVYAGLSGPDRVGARSMFLRLVLITEDGFEVRRRASRDEFAPAGQGTEHAGEGFASSLLDEFVAARLVTSDADGVIITHDVLLSAWARLREWIDTDRAGIRLHRALATARQGWTDAGHDPQWLLRGRQLDAVLAWIAESSPVLSVSEREFVAASTMGRDLARRVERSRIRRLRRLVAALAVLVLVVGALAGYDLHQTASARAERDLAFSRQLASESRDLRTKDVTLADLLAVAAFRISPTPQARAALLDATAAPAATRLVGGPGVMQAAATAPDGKLLATPIGGTVSLWPLPAGTSPHVVAEIPGTTTVFALTFLPGHVLAAAGADGRVRLIDTSRPDRPVVVATLGPLPNTVYSLSTTRDGHLLAAGDADGTVTVWDRTRPQPRVVAVLRPAAGPVHSAAFDTTGRVLTVAAGHTVALWDLADPARPARLGPVLDSPAGVVYSAALSPDGHTLAAGSADHTVYLWNTTDPTRPVPAGTLGGFTNWVNTVAFSGDGRTLAAGSSDATVRAWDLSSRRLLSTLPHPGPVTGAVFEAGGALVTSAADGTARVWPSPAAAVTAPTSVFGVQFTPDGRRLLVTSNGAHATAALWNTEHPQVPTPAGPPVGDPVSGATFTGAAALTPDGNTAVLADSTGHVMTYDVHDRSHLVPQSAPVPAATDLVESLSVSPDGHLAALAGDDHTVRLIDIADPRAPRLRATLSQPTNYVFSTVFSPDGRLLAAASADRTVRLWDLRRTGNPVLVSTLPAASSYEYAVAFAPSGHLLAVGGADRTVRLYDVTQPARPALRSTLMGPSNYVYAVAFSPDGRSLAAASTDHTVWLWSDPDDANPGFAGTLTTPHNSVYALAFAPDSHTLAAGDATPSVGLYQTDPHAAAAQICGHAGTPLTAAEWQQLAPGVPLVSPCP